MSDKELGDNIRAAAKKLASAMNEAADAGLHINIEMRPHSRVDYGNGVFKLGGYMPILSVLRTHHL